MYRSPARYIGDVDPGMLGEMRRQVATADIDPVFAETFIALAEAGASCAARRLVAEWYRRPPAALPPAVAALGAAGLAQAQQEALRELQLEHADAEADRRGQIWAGPPPAEQRVYCAAAFLAALDAGSVPALLEVRNTCARAFQCGAVLPPSLDALRQCVRGVHELPVPEAYIAAARRFGDREVAGLLDEQRATWSNGIAYRQANRDRYFAAAAAAADAGLPATAEALRAWAETVKPCGGASGAHTKPARTRPVPAC